MCLPSNHTRHVLTIVALALASISPTAAARDEVSDYLESRSLKPLLVIYIEQQLASASLEGDDRSQAMLRLASLYADLLETTNDPAQRSSLEERSRALLESVPANSSDELRLALLRNAYRGAEAIAERHRLRLSSEADLESARRSFADLVPQLVSLNDRLKSQVEVTDRRLGRAIGAEAISLQTNLERLRNRQAQTAFLAAWSMYYHGWLTGQSELVRPAEALFAELLGLDPRSPRPDDVPNDSRSEEWAARSILGMALCKSMTATSVEALQWLDLLDQARVFETVRSQVQAWRLSVHLENSEFVPALEILKQRAMAGDEIPVAWVRLAAAQALDDPRRSVQAGDLAQFAVLDLASRGEIEQIIDLVNRYGVDALGGAGFALQYVRGLIKYQEARAAHNSEEPTLNDEHAQRYKEAESILKAALVEKDIDRFASAAASCRLLIAWCAYFRSQYLDAKNLFAEASESLSGDEAADAMWMSIVCLDKLAQAEDNPTLKRELAAKVDEFLAKHPSNPHAAKLVLRRALATEDVSPKAVNELLSIPPGSDVYIPAQRRAADMLYQLFRNANGPQKASIGRQYLTVSIPLIEDAAGLDEAAESTDIDRHVARCRRVLEIALSDGVEDLASARQALRVIDRLAALPAADVGAWSNEVAFRRAQERLLSDDVEGVTEITERLWSGDPEDLWSRLAARALFKYGQQIWKDAQATGQEQRRGIELVDRYGGRVLREYADQPTALDQPSVLAYHAAVAEASLAIFEESADQQRGQAALFLFERLLAAKPRNAAFLRSCAVLSERFEKPQQAVECWRTLVSGLPQNSDGWYEAKHRLIALLAKHDIERAREVMTQHKRLYPDFGPEPWGSRLRALDVSLSSTQPDQMETGTQLDATNPPAPLPSTDEPAPATTEPAETQPDSN